MFEYTYRYRNVHKTNNMQFSLTHSEFAMLFIDRWSASEKYQTDRGKHNIKMWHSPRQSFNIMGYVTLLRFLIICSSFTTFNPISLQILTKLHNQIKSQIYCCCKTKIMIILWEKIFLTFKETYPFYKCQSLKFVRLYIHL